MCRAGSWIFQRSYYSHAHDGVVPVSGQPPFRPYARRYGGFAVRGGYSHQDSSRGLRSSYRNRRVYWDSWFQSK